jgi:DNA replication protein DnaC
MDARLDFGGFPKADRGYMMDFDYKSVLKDKDGYCIDPQALKPRWLFMSGVPGKRKTMLACRMALEWMKKDVTNKTAFLSICEWIERIQRAISQNDVIPTDMPSLPHFVVLDDFDKFSTASSWQINKLFSLIDYLYKREGQRVIITSNKSMGDLYKLSEDMGPILRRIRDRTDNNNFIVR